MGILAIETTGRQGSVALYNKGKYSSKFTSSGMNHLKEIIPLSGELLKEAAISTKELDAIVVDLGPGSFTGIRIGVTTAKTIGQMLDIPVIGLNSIEIWKNTVGDIAKREEKPFYGIVIYNARRGQVYGGIYSLDGDNIKELMLPGPYMLVDVLERLVQITQSTGNSEQTLVAFFGDGAEAYRKELESFLKEHKYLELLEEADGEMDGIRHQTAEMLLKAAIYGDFSFAFDEDGDLTECSLIKSKMKEVYSYKKIEPCYMREAEATVRLREGTLGKKRTK